MQANLTFGLAADNRRSANCGTRSTKWCGTGATALEAAAAGIVRRQRVPAHRTVVPTHRLVIGEPFRGRDDWTQALTTTSMNPTRSVSLLALSLVFVSARGAAQAAPEIVQQGVISTDKNETFPAVDPIDGSLWFSVYTDNFDRQVIMRAARGQSGWETPAAVSFSGKPWGDRAPRFSPDGRRLYISSNRPTTTGGAVNTFHLWVLERTGREWSEPKLLPSPVNSPAADRHSSETRAGDLYFSSTRPGGAGRSDIYRAKRSADGWAPIEHLPAPINDQMSQPDLLVAPNGRWMLLVITDHPQGLGGDDLFLSRFENGSWSALKHLPAPINSNEYEYGPSLSRDGQTLYFTSHRRGSADVYRVSVSALGISAR